MAIIWSAQLTDEMVAGLTDDERATLIESLDEAVQELCESYEVG